MTSLVYSKMKPNEQKARFQGIANVIFGLDSEVFVTLIEILVF